ncbi:Inner membrane protein YohK [invertebrate metagenome]|uniref:Inner membrane protein YohK n=1 Tax=invertebrate metagenome TaxID=1711999 RepID=A0A2H9TB62_9ZZZZ
MNSLITVLEHNLSSPLTVLLITLGLYQLAEWFFLHLGQKAIFHPLIIGCILVFLTIRFTPLTLNTYQNHSEILKLLLTPFTVALAIPLSRQLRFVRQHAKPLLITLLSGSALAILSGVGLAMAGGASPEVLYAVPTKAITTAVAMIVAENMGSLVPLAVAIVVLSGIVGCLTGPWLCRKCGITDHRIIGFAMGVNAHAAGAARAFEIDQTMGVYASIGMCMNALLTPLILPWVMPWIN